MKVLGCSVSLFVNCHDSPSREGKETNRGGRGAKLPRRRGLKERDTDLNGTFNIHGNRVNNILFYFSKAHI